MRSKSLILIEKREIKKFKTNIWLIIFCEYLGRKNDKKPEDHQYFQNIVREWKRGRQTRKACIKKGMGKIQQWKRHSSLTWSTFNNFILSHPRTLCLEYSNLLQRIDKRGPTIPLPKPRSVRMGSIFP